MAQSVLRVTGMNAVFAVTLIACLVLGLCGPLCRRVAGTHASMRLDRGVTAVVGKGYWVILVLVLTVGVWARVFRFVQVPLGVHRDGVMSTVDAYALAKYGTDRFGTPYPVMLWGWGHGQQSALFAYFASLFVRVLGPSRLSMRLPLLTVSLLALPVVWDWTRRMWGKNAALVTLALLCVTPWQIMQSRWGIDAHMLGHMLLFSTYFLYLGLRRRPFLYVSMIFFGLSMYAYAISFFCVPVLLVATGVHLAVNRRIKWRELIVCACLYLAVVFPLAFTMAINVLGLETMRLGPFTLQRFTQSSRMSDVLFFSELPVLEQLPINITAFLNSTLLQRGSDLPYAIPGYGLFYLFATPVYVAAIPYFWRRRRDVQLGQAQGPAPETAGGYMLISWYAAMVVCCLVTNNTSVWRATGIYYPMILMAGFLLSQVIRRIKWLALPIGLCFALGFVSFESAYFSQDILKRSGDAFWAGQYDAIEYVKKLPFEHLYISTGDSAESDFRTIAEVKILLSHQIDALEYQNEKELVDATGEPRGYYSDIYDYWTSDDGDFWADAEENAAYILWEWDLDQFDPALFSIVRFDRWAVAYPTQWMPKEALK